MSGILSALCGHYYKLTEKVEKRFEKFTDLSEQVLTFDHHLKVSEVDSILESTFSAKKAMERYQVSYEKWKETEQQILALFKRLGIRPRWYLTGQIPGELEYWVWYDDKDNVHIMKTFDLEPVDDLEPNVMYLPMPDMDEADLEDEDEDEKEEREQRMAARRARYERHNLTVPTVIDKTTIEEDDDED